MILDRYVNHSLTKLYTLTVDVRLLQVHRTVKCFDTAVYTYLASEQTSPASVRENVPIEPRAGQVYNSVLVF